MMVDGDCMSYIELKSDDRHIESESTLFGTSLNYVSMRLLGLKSDDERCVKARALIHKWGGAFGVPHWGKWWLATLGVFDWEGINAVLPELWMLPYSLPIHPGRFWCHCRVVSRPFKVHLIPRSISPWPISMEQSTLPRLRR